MAVYGNTWQYIVIHSNTWQYMALRGYTWQYMVIRCLISYRVGARHYRIFPDFLKSPVSKWRIVRVKTRTKAFFFEEILINIPSENLPRFSKERMQYFCHTLKLNWQSRHSVSASNCSMDRSARTKDDYKFSVAKDPLFNSTRICKVGDHWQEHRCDCVRTDRNLSMLEQNLKEQYRRAYLAIPVAEKSNVRVKGTECTELRGVIYVKPGVLKSHAGRIRD